MDNSTEDACMARLALPKLTFHCLICNEPGEFDVINAPPVYVCDQCKRAVNLVRSHNEVFTALANIKLSDGKQKNTFETRVVPL